MTWLEIDKEHVWHPYNSLPSKTKILPVVSTNKTSIFLQTGEELIDGMSSWWSAIHGYNHPKLNEALKKQVDIMPHIMFGGLAHEQAAILTKKLVELTGLNSVFLCDSGSVSVEVALKTAILYQKAKGLNKYKILALEHSYHGDTLGAMSVCDPQNSMHSIYGSYLSQNIFVKAPALGFNSDFSLAIEDLEKTLEKHHNEIAAFILEPVVQGAGGPVGRRECAGLSWRPLSQSNAPKPPRNPRTRGVTAMEPVGLHMLAAFFIPPLPAHRANWPCGRQPALSFSDHVIRGLGPCGPVDRVLLKHHVDVQAQGQADLAGGFVQRVEFRSPLQFAERPVDQLHMDALIVGKRVARGECLTDARF